MFARGQDSIIVDGFIAVQIVGRQFVHPFRLLALPFEDIDSTGAEQSFHATPDGDKQMQ